MLRTQAYRHLLQTMVAMTCLKWFGGVALGYII